MLLTFLGLILFHDKKFFVNLQNVWSYIKHSGFSGNTIFDILTGILNYIACAALDDNAFKLFCCFCFIGIHSM